MQSKDEKQTYNVLAILRVLGLEGADEGHVGVWLIRDLQTRSLCLLYRVELDGGSSSKSKVLGSFPVALQAGWGVLKYIVKCIEPDDMLTAPVTYTSVTRKATLVLHELPWSRERRAEHFLPLTRPIPPCRLGLAKPRFDAPIRAAIPEPPPFDGASSDTIPRKLGEINHP
jgi:hypothetical protein